MSNKTLAFLTVPGLRFEDLEQLPSLRQMCPETNPGRLSHSFPAVTWPSQATMLTGKMPSEHGVVANGFFWRDEHRVEMWTAWNEKILQPQIWDRLHSVSTELTSAAWFPMLSKGSGADFVCMPAPIHKPDGSEDLWCYTKPQEFYGDLLEAQGHFPLQHFWGPLANIKSTQWIVQSLLTAAERFRPRFLYIYLPHLDYAAQKEGPNSEAAQRSLAELDQCFAALHEGLSATYSDDELEWLIASEYVITEVDHVCYPNRLLREDGLLTVSETDDGELLDFAHTPAWALVDHQFSHVFVKDGDKATISRVSQLFEKQTGIAEVLAGDDRKKYGLDHERSGDVILVSTPSSWQAYYWWFDDQQAPGFARTVDIHRKPGYDPVELHFDFATKSVPLDASLIKGSHGAPVESEAQRGVLWSSSPALFQQPLTHDTEICEPVVRWLGS